MIDKFISFANRASLEWFDLKTLAERSVSFHDDALHVMVGVLLQLLIAAVLRSSASRIGPWLCVLALELANEAGDLHYDLWPANARSSQFGEGLKDVLLTLFLPTVLLIVSRRFPTVLGRRR